VTAMKQPKFRRRTVLAAPAALSAAAAAQGTDERPRVLITCAAHPLAKTLARKLAAECRIRLTDRESGASEHEFVQASLSDEKQTASVVQGVHAIVHVAEPGSGESESQHLDWLTRGTYHLLNAASRAGVSRFVFLSTLDSMTSYDASFTVSESWRPRPSTSVPVLSKHLGEMVCREFARDRRIRATVLRLGKVVKAAETTGREFDPMWVDEEDAAHAVSRAIAVTAKDNQQGIGSWWSVLHIGSDSPGARFSLAGAKYVLNYQPKVKW